MNYTIGYIDFETNSLSSSENLYNDISLAAYDLNFTISETILKKYDILLRNSFLFVCKDELKDSFNTLKISNNKSILTEKKGLELNIFLQNERKGYIYNAQDKVLIYKFFINKHNTESLNNEPFEVKGSSIAEESSPEIPFEQGEVFIVNEQKEDSNNKNPVIIDSNTNEKERGGSIWLATGPPIIRTVYTQPKEESSKEFSFTTDDLVVLENWLDKNESFVKELSEKVKKYKIE